MNYAPKPGDVIETGSPPVPSLPPPTPQVPPTLFGMLQAMGTAWATYKIAQYTGVPPEYATMIAGTVASTLTSGLHKWAQSIHRKEIVS